MAKKTTSADAEVIHLPAELSPESGQTLIFETRRHHLGDGFRERGLVAAEIKLLEDALEHGSSLIIGLGYRFIEAEAKRQLVRSQLLAISRKIFEECSLD